MQDLIDNYFGDFGGRFCKKLAETVSAVLHANRASTGMISESLSIINKKNLRANQMGIYRFLQDDDFLIEDKFWRCHFNLIFDFLRDKYNLQTGDLLAINVDFTSHEDNFLILTASLDIGGKSVLLYFSTRCYPKKANQYNHKNMENAFINELRHLLSKKYSYQIVADRGFGNARFKAICQAKGFHFMLRINPDLTLNNKTDNLKNHTNKTLNAYVDAWKSKECFIIKDDWYILTDMPEIALETYEKRFKIEKLFQDLKSSGFEIEKSKIRKYNRFRRILYLTAFSHLLSVIIGFTIKTTFDGIKKNFSFPETMIKAYLSSDASISNIASSKPSTS